MKSIKNKLLLAIILINSLILIGIGYFTVNFESFYIKYTSKQLNSFAQEIDMFLGTSSEKDFEEYIVNLSEDKNISVDIYDENGFLVISNKMLSSHMGMMRKNKYEIVKQYKVSSKLTSYMIQENSNNIEFLSTYVNSQNNNYTIITKTPISAIKSSVMIASNFLLSIFIPIIILSIILAIWFSNKFTKPIIHLKSVTDKIASLNFEEVIDIQTGDEIEKLGDSVNTLSFKIRNTLEDLTNKNNQLECMLEKQKKEDKLKREFVSSVSHELKTPITVISGYAEGLRSDVIETKEDVEYYIDVIYEESEKMAIMVNDLLDLYKLESKSFTMRKEIINISELISDIIDKFEFILKEENIKVNTNIDDVYIEGDRIRIGQVINNFLDNAIHHIDKNKKINIYTEQTDNKVKINLYNSGENIKEDNIEKIWYSFARVDDVRTSSQNRVGLGLAIVREIMNLNNGEYGVFNVDNGVVFWIELNKAEGCELT